MSCKGIGVIFCNLHMLKTLLRLKINTIPELIKLIKIVGKPPDLIKDPQMILTCYLRRCAPLKRQEIRVPHSQSKDIKENSKLN